MKKEVLKNWLRLATVFVCVMFALVLLMAEHNECGSIAKWYGLFVATKVGAVACGFVALIEVEKLTEEIKK